MSYKNLEERRKNYAKNKDEINRKRRKYGKSPEVKAKKSIRQKEWREANLEKRRENERKYGKKYRRKLKLMAIKNYGGKCNCCGEKNPAFLSIDHINQNGAEHRKEIGTHIEIWLRKNNYPRGFQVLCFNCNWGKHINNGICPHKQIK